MSLKMAITILDEHYNNVKALDALNQELFQLWMGKKETVLEWQVHLLKHLQILMALFLEHFPLDHVAELNHDCFYRGLPKQFKVMVVYLKASGNEKMYSYYLQTVQQAEKVEAMEPSCNPPLGSANKCWAMSFFPMQKLKGSQLTMTPSAWVVQLEEESTDKEECIDSEDTDGIKGITEEFTVCLAKAVKDAQQEKCCYHCSNPDHFICNSPLVAASRIDSHLNWKEGMAPKKGAWASQGKVTLPNLPQDGTPKV